MARPSLVGHLRRAVDWRAVLRQPRSWAILARHLVPVAGVVLLGWSGLQGVAAIVLDTLASLWGVAAVAAWFVTLLFARKADHFDTFQFVATVVFLFLFVAGLLTFLIAVLFFVLWGSVIGGAQPDRRELIQGAWIWVTLGGLVALQVPRVLGFASEHTPETAQAAVRREVDYLLRRFLLVGAACSVLAILPGELALVAALSMAQVVLAAHEILGDELHAVLFPEPAVHSR